ncbi:ImmA/IrrE family metallo-endopeptidase [Oxalobacteraceae bacterium OM1]|nr:ImmA/IrrE family metallo-endopeptidase [Oxalobacteraceae bacterium OM1]
MKTLLALPANALLDKFGSGGHAPGSGSAAALLGLLSANLVVTVGRLTLERAEYRLHHPAIEDICNRIEATLVPLLTTLFQDDAEAFDQVIRARRARDAAADEREKRTLAAAALDQLKLATEIPFKIAAACLELIDLSGKVFDVGFKGARGDTGVALSAALAGVTSSAFVISLNLKSFKGTYWARQRRQECDQLQKTATTKYEAALARMARLRAEDVASSSDADADPIATLWSSAKTKYSGEDIESRASDLRRIIWHRRAELWADAEVPADPAQLLEPEVALRLLGYSFNVVETLGSFPLKGKTYEVAGLLEAQPGRVSVSRQLRQEVRRFTAAHELGHVILHPQLKEAHRDRPIDGSEVARTRIEAEADKFASSFLMPAALVRSRFATTFGQGTLSLTDDTAFALFGTGLGEARQRLTTLRDLSVLLASAERYNGRPVVSLAKQFRVSPTALAIRLEELDLLRMDS